jgi:thiamine biosynthesis lipoprotein
MGTVGLVTLVGGSERLLDDAWALADRIEQLWSRFIPTSDVTRLNWSEGEPTVVDPLTVRLIEEMQEGASVTNNDFDPTLLPDVLAAGYATSLVDPTRTTTLPASAVAPGKIQDIRIDGTTVTMPIGTTIDPGGIGKGLAADLICEYTMAIGAWGVMAALGGDIAVDGEAPDGIAWRIGVEDPFDTSKDVTAIRMEQGAIVTSSQRIRRFPNETGERHHLINPRTHDSAVTNIQTVTIIAGSGGYAEALTKPGFVRDTAEFLAWLPTVNAAGLIIDDKGTLIPSENWELYL